jgi:hypothetical protein
MGSHLSFRLPHFLRRGLDPSHLAAQSPASDQAELRLSQGAVDVSRIAGRSVSAAK